MSTDDLAEFEMRLLSGLDSRLGGCAGVGLPALNRLVRQYVTRGGKRIRPQLCLWSCRAAGADLTEAAFDLAATWEVFHAFLLAHDDLMDAADTRRGLPSLHRQLQSLDHDSPAFGRNLAIVAGDLLFGVAIGVLSRLDAPPATVVSLMTLFSDIACVTGQGQAIDLLQSQTPLESVDLEDVLHGYQCKTAAYTFEGPMVSGAILAGASPESIATITVVARAIGQAYQLHNDLSDLAAPAHAGCDLIQGKRTVTLIAAREGMTDVDRRRFDIHFGRLGSAEVSDAESLRRRLHDTDAIERTRSMIDTLLIDASTAAAADAALGGPLSQLIDSIRSTFFVDPVPAGLS